MSRFTRTLLVLLLCCANCAFAHRSACASGPVKIGVLSFRPKPQTLSQWQPLAIGLKKAMPAMDFEIVTLTYPELNKAVANREVQFVFTNPGHFVFLKMQGKLSAPLATLAVDVQGTRATQFGGVIVTRAGRTDINTLSDLKGKKIAVPDQESLGGYQMQAYELSRAGVHLPKDVALLVTGMPHDNVVKAVAEGRADAGFVRSGVLEDSAKEGKVDLKALKVLNRLYPRNFPLMVSTQLYPEWPFAALSNIDENLARHIAATLFTLEENRPVIQALNIQGFSVPADYTPVEELLRALRFPPFDVAPAFTFDDVWHRYHWHLAGALLSLIITAALTLWLLYVKRTLEVEKHLVLTQREKLQENEALLRTIFDNVPECIQIIEADGVLTGINPPGLAIVGAKKPEEVIAQPVFQMIAPEYRDDFQEMHRQVILGQKKEMKLEILCQDGARRLVETHAVPIQVRGSAAHLGVTRDITEQNRMEKQLEQMAHHDPLTGLPNRALFSDRISHAISVAHREGTRMAILFIDLDQFKLINDTFGHALGDVVLQKVAKRIQSCVRESDTVARIGGDEFILLLHQINDKKDAVTVAEKIRQEINQPLETQGNSLKVSPSIGIAIYPEDGTTETDWCRNADIAMYLAKESGRNTIKISPPPGSGGSPVTYRQQEKRDKFSGASYGD